MLKITGGLFGGGSGGLVRPAGVTSIYRVYTADVQYGQWMASDGAI